MTRETRSLIRRWRERFTSGVSNHARLSYDAEDLLLRVLAEDQEEDRRYDMDEKTFLQQLLLMHDDLTKSRNIDWAISRLKDLLERRLAEQDDGTLVYERQRPKAQKDERRTPNTEVAGSSPAGATNQGADIHEAASHGVTHLVCFEDLPLSVIWIRRDGQIVGRSIYARE